MSLPLSGSTFLEATATRVGRYAGQVLGSLGATVISATSGAYESTSLRRDAHVEFDGVLASAPMVCHDSCEVVMVAPDGAPGFDWADSGAMALTGSEPGPARMLRGPVASRLLGAAAALEMVTAVAGQRVRVDGPALLGERAALQGLHRRGITSVGGACRLIEASDGWMAVNLPRRRDLDLVEAWLGIPSSATILDDLQAATLGASRGAIIDRGRQLGMAAAPVISSREAFSDEQAVSRGQSHPPGPWVIDGKPLRPVGGRTTAGAAHRGGRNLRRSPLVLDLSSLWAGPLCASFVMAAGARVIKVEMPRRPDGTRGTQFFDLLNAGKECIALDFQHEEGRKSLASLLDAADIVIESFRPRVMESLGVHPETWLDRREGRVWASITGYGRTGPGRQWVAFGDDAAVAGGAVAVVENSETSPVFCADAMADPVSGLYAAIAVVAAWSSGLGHMVDLALREVTGHVISGLPLDLPKGGHVVSSAGAPPRWVLRTAQGDRAVVPPRARNAIGKGSPIDGDGRRLREEFSLLSAG